MKVDHSACRIFKLNLVDLVPVLLGRGRIASMPEDARILDVRDAGMARGAGVDILVWSSEFGRTSTGQYYPIETAVVVFELKEVGVDKISSQGHASDVSHGDAGG